MALLDGERDALEKSFNRLTEDSDTIVLLNDVEEKFRAKGDVALADRVNKIQVDIGAYYSGAEDGGDGGELGKHLVDGYEKLTVARVSSLMNDVETALKGDPLAADFAKLATDVRGFLAGAAAPKARPAAAGIRPM